MYPSLYNIIQKTGSWNINYQNGRQNMAHKILKETFILKHVSVAVGFNRTVMYQEAHFFSSENEDCT